MLTALQKHRVNKYNVNNRARNTRACEEGVKAQYSIETTIKNATMENVFRTVANPHHLKEATSNITSIEVLDDVRYDVQNEFLMEPHPSTIYKAKMHGVMKSIGKHRDSNDSTASTNSCTENENETTNTSHDVAIMAQQTLLEGVAKHKHNKLQGIKDRQAPKATNTTKASTAAARRKIMRKNRLATLNNTSHCTTQSQISSPVSHLERRSQTNRGTSSSKGHSFHPTISGCVREIKIQAIEESRVMLYFSKKVSLDLNVFLFPHGCINPQYDVTSHPMIVFNVSTPTHTFRHKYIFYENKLQNTITIVDTVDFYSLPSSAKPIYLKASKRVHTNSLHVLKSKFNATSSSSNNSSNNGNIHDYS
eukprot:m.18899 g.18899  ORF g.18899 m.18899 type:complete len:364 (-) comp5028_c0_seq1:1623-2714(-)